MDCRKAEWDALSSRQLVAVLGPRTRKQTCECRAARYEGNGLSDREKEGPWALRGREEARTQRRRPAAESRDGEGDRDKHSPGCHYIQSTFPLVESNTHCNLPKHSCWRRLWVHSKAGGILPGSGPPRSPTGLWVGLHLPLCAAGMLLLFPLPFTALRPGLR